jgi:two-component system, OmpR family, phosphate regulon sensor histidine kinase PhoR
MLVSVFLITLACAVVAIPIGLVWGVLQAALAVLAVLLFSAWVMLWKTYRLERWLSQPDLLSPLSWRGVWGEIVQRIQRQLRQREKQVTQAEQRLQYFLQAIQASPNGVTLLDAQGRIEWCNDAASVHLGVDMARDHLQHVVHLVRDPVFSRYFSQSTHDKEVVIEGRSTSISKSLKLSVQLHAYGDGQQLLLSRDITSLTLAEAMRRDFVANVSHEIRTPLTVLSGFVETLQNLPLDENERQHYLHMMSVQADRMQTLVADLLTLSQLEGSSPPGLHERVPLAPLMTQILTDARALSAVLSGYEGEERRPVHELVVEIPHDAVFLGVRSELLSAMSNLVSNAVRYTPAGGYIRVAWEHETDHVIFSVTDSGPGIAPEHLPRLSERFYRVDRSRSRETGGTGLGLAIAKHVAQRHGGELRIHSQVGQGSTFMLVFPASRVELT